jgi:hypothetical protein
MICIFASSLPARPTQNASLARKKEWGTKICDWVYKKSAKVEQKSAAGIQSYTVQKATATNIEQILDEIDTLYKEVSSIL